MIRFRRGVLVVTSVALAVLTACDGHPKGAHPGEGKEEGSAHAHVAPHGGALVELGEEFAHVELVLDPAEGRLTAYVLDGEAEKAVRLAAPELKVSILAAGGGSPVEVALKPVGSELTGETPGDTSQFEGRADTLKGLARFEGRLVSIEVKGKRFESVEFGYPEGNE